jgi:hypothetical protein
MSDVLLMDYLIYQMDTEAFDLVLSFPCDQDIALIIGEYLHQALKPYYDGWGGCDGTHDEYYFGVPYELTKVVEFRLIGYPDVSMNVYTSEDVRTAKSVYVATCERDLMDIRMGEYEHTTEIYCDFSSSEEFEERDYLTQCEKLFFEKEFYDEIDRLRLNNVPMDSD